MEMIEGNLKFTFLEDSQAMKFDEDKFYRTYYSKLPKGKGVDFIINNDKDIVFLEIKDCYGYERENLGRTLINNREIESFDIEVAKKIESTISCIVGAYTRKRRCEIAEELTSLYENINLYNISEEKKKAWVILFLEGDFKVKTRTKRMIMEDIQKSLKQKLSWLECQVLVFDSKTNREKFFKVERYY